MACVLKVNKSMKTRDPIYKLPKCLEVELGRHVSLSRACYNHKAEGGS
jgi:hypothetical protein